MSEEKKNGILNSTGEDEKRKAPGQPTGASDTPGGEERRVDSAPASTGADDDELVAAQKKTEEYYARLVRTQADFENYKRRMRNEREEMSAFAAEALIVKFLPVIDNLERALASAAQTSDAKALADGVEMVLRQIFDWLEKEGVVQIQAQGQMFDPYEHHAVMQVPNSELPENTVVTEILKGYRMKDKVIRPSMVGVAKPEE